MNTKGAGFIGGFNVQTVLVAALVLIIVLNYMGFLNIQPKGDSGIEVYILNEKMEPMATISGGSTYALSVNDALGTITYNGQTVGGVGFSLWVLPVGGDEGSAQIRWVGYRTVGTLSGQVTSGTANEMWGSKVELIWDKVTDSWIQVTDATLTFLNEGQHTVNVNYDVTASGLIDGVTKTATANPSIAVDVYWAAGTMNITAGINNSALNFA